MNAAAPARDDDPLVLREPNLLGVARRGEAIVEQDAAARGRERPRLVRTNDTQRELRASALHQITRSGRIEGDELELRELESHELPTGEIDHPGVLPDLPPPIVGDEVRPEPHRSPCGIVCEGLWRDLPTGRAVKSELGDQRSVRLKLHDRATPARKSRIARGNDRPSRSPARVRSGRRRAGRARRRAPSKARRSRTLRNTSSRRRARWGGRGHPTRLRGRGRSGRKEAVRAGSIRSARKSKRPISRGPFCL
jgi:hypothetical protein